MTQLSTAPHLEALDDDQLVTAWQAAGLEDSAVYAAYMAEFARRDRLDRLARARAGLAGLRAEAAADVEAQYLAASAACRGELLNAAGRRAVRDDHALWAMPERDARRYASEELGEWWDYSAPRVTAAQYVRARLREARLAASQARDAARAAGGSIRDDDGPRLDRDAAGALRHEPAAPQAPQAGTGGAVQRGGRGPAGGGEAAEPAGGDGGAGGAVRGRGHDMTTITSEAPAPVTLDGPEHEARRAQARAAIAAQRQAMAARGAAACRHPHRIGTPGQCGNCPARQAASALAVRSVIDVRPSQVTAGRARERIDGAALLEDVRAGLRHFAVWPSEAALVTAALWAAQRHAVDGARMPVWQYSPHLFFTSKEGGSGKSAMTKLVLRLAPGPKLLLEPTKASLVAFIAKRATVGVTEMDVLVGNGTRNRWLTAIANGAFDPEPVTAKMVAGKEVEIPLFGGMALDGLDSVIHATGVELRTLISRCIVVRVRRAPDGYRAPRMDSQARAAFEWARDQLGLWMAQEVQDGIGEDVPAVPEGLGNRPAALWEPLLAVAGRAGGSWPGRAREACETLEAAAGACQDEEEAQRHRSVFGAWAAQAGGQDDDDDLM